MIQNTIRSILETIRSLRKNPGSLAIFAGLYALLLATLYGFIAIREATVLQVLLTLLFIAGAPAIFFLLQAAIINRARAGQIDWYRALSDSCKLALLSVPLILVGWGIAYLLNRWQAHYLAPHISPMPVSAASGKAAAAPPIHRPTLLFATARALIFGIALPLIMIQLWVVIGKQNLIAFFRSGPRAVLTSLRQALARAFAPESVLIYALGLIVFALIPYVLLFVHVPVKGYKSELIIFSVRLVLAFGFTLVGWVMTLSTFARTSDDFSLPSAVTDRAPSEGEVQPAGST